jgi:hypothetical protein
VCATRAKLATMTRYKAASSLKLFDGELFKLKRLPMSDPNIFHKTRSDQTDAAATRAVRARTVRTAVLVLRSTAIWGVMAFVLISDTATAMLATILIGLATLTVRLLGTD